MRLSAVLQENARPPADLVFIRRSTRSFDNLRLAADGVLTATTAHAKIAAQDAINAAQGVLGAAINQSVGIALLSTESTGNAIPEILTAILL
jgi:hypothetical protein